MKKNKSNPVVAALAFVRACGRDTWLLPHIRYIALLGSVREKEFVTTYSDLDLLLVLQSDSSGVIGARVLQSLQAINNDLSHRYRIPISLLTHTVYEFEHYVDPTYLTHYSWGRVLLGAPRVYRTLFQKILRKKQTSGTALKKVAYVNIIHARFNLFRRYVSLNPANTPRYKRFILKLFIDNVLEIANWCLIGENIWPVRKIEIAHAFEKHFPTCSQRSLPCTAYRIRKEWSKLQLPNAAVDTFIQDAIQFVNACVILAEIS